MMLFVFFLLMSLLMLPFVADVVVMVRTIL